jgi:two-component system, sensor histidine kinase LadS
LKLALIALVAAAALLPAAARASSPLDLGGADEIVDLTPYVAVYEDKTSTLDFAAARRASYAPVDRISFGDPNATYWVRFSFFDAKDFRPWLLTAGYRPYEVDFYSDDGKVQQSGDAVPYAMRPRPVYNWIVFDLPLTATAQEERTVYLKIRTDEPLVNLVAYDDERFGRDVTRDTVVIAALIAILSTLVLSSVILYFVMRDSLYLYYAGYIVAQGVYRANDFGLLQAYVFPHASFPYVRTEVVFDGITLIAATLFIRRFLRSQVHSRTLDRINVAIAAIGGLYAALALAGLPVRYTLVQNFAFVYVPVWMATGIASWRKGYAPARLFLAAWTAYMIGILVEAAVDAGVGQSFGIARETTLDVVLDYIVYLGIALESILLALSLAQAYRTATAEKIEQLNELIAMRERTERMAHLAYSDGLTNLPNRTAFVERVDEALRAARRHARRCALLFLDLDGFKAINDTYGHRAGDAALIEVAARLRTTVRGDEMVGRLGGDEFGIFIPALEGDSDVAHVAQRIGESLGRPLTVDGRTVPTSVSIGVAYFPDPCSDREQLFASADAEMYKSKRRG